MTATLRGRFVVFEGGDGVGKSTQTDLLMRHLQARGVAAVRTFEPGDSTIGRTLRQLLLDPASGAVDPRAESLIYAADKAQHLFETVEPALSRGDVVVCDRYVDSMIAYQGAGRVLAVDEIARIADWATRGLRPDLTVLLDLDPAEAVAHKQRPDRLESAGLAFHTRAREHFLALADADAEHYLVLPARDPREDLAARIAERVDALLAAS